MRSADEQPWSPQGAHPCLPAHTMSRESLRACAYSSRQKARLVSECCRRRRPRATTKSSPRGLPDVPRAGWSLLGSGLTGILAALGALEADNDRSIAVSQYRRGISPLTSQGGAVEVGTSRPPTASVRSAAAVHPRREFHVPRERMFGLEADASIMPLALGFHSFGLGSLVLHGWVFSRRCYRRMSE